MEKDLRKDKLELDPHIVWICPLHNIIESTQGTVTMAKKFLPVDIRVYDQQEKSYYINKILIILFSD